ncbi:hypothetical protein [Neptunicoccus sediminis]|uniref:hypothetical protein n=1 Tax=Neptunicoccus sediminis TaxID=1892596 RepID=UPI001C12A037|nr:hypothetical protein [Neptunicoccus sediminis]
MPDRTKRPTLPSRPGRRFRDAATLLPVTGLLLLLTPLMSIFTRAQSLFGLPVSFFYVFSVWAGLILLAFFLARRALRINVSK